MQALLFGSLGPGWPMPQRCCFRGLLEVRCLDTLVLMFMPCMFSSLHCGWTVAAATTVPGYLGHNHALSNPPPKKKKKEKKHTQQKQRGCRTGASKAFSAGIHGQGRRACWTPSGASSASGCRSWRSAPSRPGGRSSRNGQCQGAGGPGWCLGHRGWLELMYEHV